ncbi:hypothetical protein D9M68_500890 [compost metagenome]
MMSAPCWITPPMVFTRMFFTVPFTGALMVVRFITSSRAPMFSLACASSPSKRVSSALASARYLFWRSAICRRNSLAWRFMRRTSTSDIRPRADSGSDSEISRSASCRLRCSAPTLSLSVWRRAL